MRGRDDRDLKRIEKDRCSTITDRDGDSRAKGWGGEGKRLSG